MKRSVFIADAQTPFRAGLRDVLEQAGFTIVGESADVRAAVDSIAQLQPELCLIDGDSDAAVLVTKRIVSFARGAHVIVLAAEMTTDALLAVIRAGACGYVSRSMSGAAIVRVVEAVLAGEYAISRLGVTDMINEVRTSGRKRHAIGGVSVSLTERESQVFDLLADGLQTHEIASSLELSPVTVRRHVGAIREKAGRPGRRELLQGIRAS